jgi:hypothetical protein
LWSRVPKTTAIRLVIAGKLDELAALSKKEFVTDVDRPATNLHALGTLPAKLHEGKISIVHRNGTGLAHRNGKGLLGWVIRPDGVVSLSIYRSVKRGAFRGEAQVLRMEMDEAGHLRLCTFRPRAQAQDWQTLAGAVSALILGELPNLDEPDLARIRDLASFEEHLGPVKWPAGIVRGNPLGFVGAA